MNAADIEFIARFKSAEIELAEANAEIAALPHDTEAASLAMDEILAALAAGEEIPPAAPNPARDAAFARQAAAGAELAYLRRVARFGYAKA